IVAFSLRSVPLNARWVRRSKIEAPSRRNRGLRNNFPKVPALHSTQCPEGAAMCEMCDRENASHGFRNFLAILTGIISVSAAHSASNTSEIPTAVAADIQIVD